MTAILVTPVEALEARPRLFSALAAVFDVSFTGHGSASRIDAAIVVGDSPVGPEMPTLVLGPGRAATVQGSTVQLAKSASLDRHLRGWEIDDESVSGVPALGAHEGADILATCAGSCLWCRDASGVERAVLLPEELGPRETLLSRLRPGRFFALLPVVHFLRRVAEGAGWALPSVRASFLMDDPNLRRTTYGYLDFERIADVATRTGIHLSVAMIPIDRRVAGRTAAALFRDAPHALSLVVHGNNHTRHELADGRDAEARLGMVAQALQRVASFESRTGLRVARVMVAPHGRCAEETARDMVRVGFESMCMSRTFPWLDEPPAGSPLAGWFPSDTSSVIPIVPRIPLTSDPALLPLRAFLRQPLIISGHHWDLAGQDNLLEEWAAHVRRIGVSEWAAVGEISRSMYSYRLDGSTLVVRPHTRLVALRVPEGASTILIDAPTVAGYEIAEVTMDSAAPLSGPSRELMLPVTRDAVVTVRLLPGEAVATSSVSQPQPSLWPLARRRATEARDRLKPLFDRARS